MTDPAAPPPRPGRGLGWFLVVSGAIVLFLTLGCALAFGNFRPFSDEALIALVFGSPILLLGAVFLWLGMRRLKR
jgi:hypothetical protein